eukprot:1158098-Pelagomonas_calceolata.AAC.6
MQGLAQAIPALAPFVNSFVDGLGAAAMRSTRNSADVLLYAALAPAQQVWDGRRLTLASVSVLAIGSFWPRPIVRGPFGLRPNVRGPFGPAFLAGALLALYWQVLQWCAHSKPDEGGHTHIHTHAMSFSISFPSEVYVRLRYIGGRPLRCGWARGQARRRGPRQQSSSRAVVHCNTADGA